MCLCACRGVCVCVRMEDENERRSEIDVLGESLVKVSSG